MSHDPESIRLLTQRYRFLRGLEQVPIALAFLAMAAANALDLLWSPIVLVVLLALAIPASRAIGRYYDRRFGVVKAPGWGGRTLVLVLVTFFALQSLSAVFSLPVQLGFLAAGVGLAVYALRNFALEGQRLLLAVFFIVISVWPPISVPWDADVWQSAAGLGLPVVWTLMALWDHRMLVKAFERARLTDVYQVSWGGE